MADVPLTTSTIVVVENEPRIQLVLEHLRRHSAPDCAVLSARPADHSEVIVPQVRDRAGAYSGTRQEGVWLRS
jgi:hypothetical protein